jgi:hypothetical protein
MLSMEPAAPKSQLGWLQIAPVPFVQQLSVPQLFLWRAQSAILHIPGALPVNRRIASDEAAQHQFVCGRCVTFGTARILLTAMDVVGNAGIVAKIRRRMPPDFHNNLFISSPFVVEKFYAN